MRRPPKRALILLASAALVALAGAALPRAPGAAQPDAPQVPAGKLFGGS